MADLVFQSLSNMEVSIEFFQKIALATFIGILIGIEREHRCPEGRELIAGVRTFTIACIAGMISAYLAKIVNPGILLISLAFFTMISVLYVYLKNVTLKQPGITSPVALYCTFLLGVLISYDLFLNAIVGAVVITLLLAEKRPLHSFATNLTDDEIRSAVRFLVVVFILYPITPDELFIGIINPRWILLIVIMVATISFISFIIMKKMGTRFGTPLSGLLGGLVSSQATTGALAAMAKKRNELVEPAYAGIILANAAMRIMNLVTAFIVDPSGRVLLFMAAPQLVIASFAIIVLIKSRNRNKEPVNETIKLQSPFALSPAIRFAIGFAALSILLRFVNLWAGTAGVYATALGGFISSDVVTASVAALAVDGHISYETAALTGVLATIISTVSTMILVKWAGPPELARMVYKTFRGFIIVGTIVLIIWGIVITGY
jgi:uncharacterized membrane protein (DUF4010 family)